MDQTTEPISEEARHQEHLLALTEALDRASLEDVRAQVSELHPAEVADLLESLPSKDRDRVWEQLDADLHTDVLAYAEDAVRARRMLQMGPEEVAAAAQDLETDDAVDLLQDLPEKIVDEVLQSMDAQNRERLQSVLAYPEDTAGGLMNIDTITVRGDVDLETVIRYLRLKSEVPEKTDSLMVVDRENYFQGMLPLTRLLVGDPETPVAEVMNTDVKGIAATTSDRDVAQMFEKRDLLSAPVVDDDGRLLGRITIDDVVDVIRDEGEHSLMSMAGLDEEDDMFAPAFASARRRNVWLGINLGTALLASWVIGLFEATIQEVVALAVLMPVVASMGGIAGSQTLTVVIRGMALGQVGQSNAGDLMVKELLVGIINSLLWAVVVALVAVFWFQSTSLGLIVGAALIINLVIAALAGASIPLLLRKLSIDPALAGGVVLTTVTDVIGFLAFLGLGTIFLLN
jgi:magnesium transporter